MKLDRILQDQVDELFVELEGNVSEKTLNDLRAFFDKRKGDDEDDNDTGKLLN